MNRPTLNRPTSGATCFSQTRFHIGVDSTNNIIYSVANDEVSNTKRNEIVVRMTHVYLATATWIATIGFVGSATVDVLEMVQI